MLVNKFKFEHVFKNKKIHINDNEKQFFFKLYALKLNYLDYPNNSDSNIRIIRITQKSTIPPDFGCRIESIQLII